MPPTGAEKRVKDPEYNNWLRVGLALYYLKVGLCSFIKGEVDAMHKILLKKIYCGSAVYASQCSICKSSDVKQNRHLYTWKFRFPCPNSVCDSWLTELLAFHANPTSSKICCENCEVTDWPRAPWECAKLYMPRGQPPTNTNPAQSDSQALLTLMSNCTFFHTKLSKGALQLIHKVSTIRNRVMHSGDMRLSDSDNNSFIQDIINLLEDSTHLNTLEECKEAVTEINKIKNESLDVSFNIDLEMKVLRECVNDCRQELGVHQEETDRTVNSLKEELKNLTVQFDTFEKINKDKVEDLDSKCKNMDADVSMLVRHVASNMEDVKGELKILNEEIKLIKERSTQAIKATELTSLEIMESDVRDIQLLFIKAYESVQIISVNPVFDTAVSCKDLEDFYTNVVIEEEREDSSQMRRNEEQANKVTVTTPAGQGKSTFCRKLVHTWCSVQKRKLSIIEDDKISDKSDTYGLKDEDEMLRFDVLLYICLRDISDEKTLMDVIHTQFPLHESQYLSHRYHIGALLGQVEENKVLIIMEGLDEMENSSSFITKIMQKSLYPHVTVLASTRPWKIGQLSLIRSAHIDLLLNLHGFNYENSMLFAERIFRNCYKDEYAISRFKQDILKYHVIRGLINVPLLLLFIIHVWYEKKSFTQTIHELYMEILNVMVDRYMEGRNKKSKGNLRQDENKYVLPNAWPTENTTFILTPKLKNMSLVQHFGEEFLAALCDVANHFLINDEKESSLVYEEKNLMKLLGKDGFLKLQTALELGIFSNSESAGIFGKKICLTFLHKTVQEYLAAIGICCSEGRCKIFIDSLNTLDDVFKNEKIIIFVVSISASHCQTIFQKIYEVCDIDIDQNQHGPMIRRKYTHYLCRLYKDCIAEACREPLSLQFHSLYADNQEDWNVLQIALQSTSNSRMLTISKCDQLKCLDLSHCKFVDSTLDLSKSNCLTEISLKNVTLKGRLLLSKCTQLKCLKLVCCSLDDTTLDLSESNCLNELNLKHVTMKGELFVSNCTQLMLLELAFCSLDDSTLVLSKPDCGTGSFNHGTMKSKLLLSKCTQLKCVKLVYCGLEDSTMDLSESTALTTLSLEFVTMKGKLLLSKCTQLKCVKLVCCRLDKATLDLLESNCLSELSLKHVTMNGNLFLSKCSELKYLELAHCSFDEATLDLSTSPCLSKLSLELVTMKGNLLLSNCTHLKCLQLAYYILDDVRIDLSESTCLKNLSLELVTIKGELVLSNCTHLTCLEMAYCNLNDATLDLSESNYLTCLRLKHVTMKGKMRSPRCAQLRFLELSQCSLDHITFDLSESNCLTELSLDGVNMTIKLLPSMCTQLKCLRLAHCSLNDASLDLSECNCLIDVRLEDMKVKLVVSKCTQLSCLELAHCILDYTTLDLSESDSLTELSLKYVTMKGKLLISKCKKLKNLDLAYCEVDAATLDLTGSKCLTKLSLKEVTMKGQLLLSNCTHLQCLKLVCFGLDDATLDLSGSPCLVKFIVQNVTMKSKFMVSKCTKLKCSDLTYYSVNYVTLDFSNSNVLTKLVCRDVTMNVKLLISKCTLLKCLELVCCGLDDAILDLSESNCLTELSLEDVNIKGKLLLINCTQLNCLGLAYCSFDDAMLDLTENNSLTKLSLKHVTIKGKLLLFKCTQLKCLELAQCSLENATLDLSESNCLTEVIIEDVTMKGELLLSNCTHLKCLKLVNCILDNATLDLSESYSLTDWSIQDVTTKSQPLLANYTQHRMSETALL
ncbi:hypothetical protein CHS0354_036256 [Potamilus streckersoni]|uniref:NACHT domain-containing protein n=1 Tax=Potamilus streckersoni TaxID=2493646 RepID=A0AAE0SVH9_9BIVA|nr:hypothetical protein CHS0354_036256 [Potamilus streckersoni]